MGTAMTLMTLDKPKAKCVTLSDLRALVAEADRRGLTDDAEIYPQSAVDGRILAFWIAGGREPQEGMPAWLAGS